MKIKATIASFLVASACCALARATDDSSFPNSAGNSTVPAHDGEGLLIPRLDDISGGSRETGWNGRTSDSFNLFNRKPAYRSSVRTEKVSRRTAPASPHSESDNRQPWAVALIVFGGLTGALGAVAVGWWRRVNRRCRARSFVPAVLVASLRENQMRIAEPPKIVEQQTSKTRRAA